MRLNVRSAAWLVAVVATAVAFKATAAERAWLKLRGTALTQAFTNQDFGDGVHFAYQFLEGGDLQGTDMGKPTRGHWRVAGGELCWRCTKSRDPEACYEVRRQGASVRLEVDGQEVLSGKLTPLSPKPMEVTR